MRGHFWYSRKQRKIVELSQKHKNYALLDTGGIVEYTEMSSKNLNDPNPNPYGKWDDYIYLGKGIYFGRRIPIIIEIKDDDG